MRILVAGATGAIGAPLSRLLRTGGHEVIGITRTPENADRLRAAGVVPVVADLLDRAGLLAALAGHRADAVIHEGTALKKLPLRHAGMRPTNALRTAGTANLVAAARAVGARRFLTQSIVFGYGYGRRSDRPLTEDDPFGVPVPGAPGEHVAAMLATERQAFEAPGMEGIALRYGLFYGSGAGMEGIVERLRRRRFPVPAGGGGLAPLIHVRDAAAATVTALERGVAGRAYNIVDDQPVRWGDFLDALAEAFGAPRPRRVPLWLMRLAPYPYLALTTSMRVSNALARRELGWAPAVPTYLDGIRDMARADR
jgi:nucleoside-diphosphate-sugar epimerase